MSDPDVRCRLRRVCRAFAPRKSGWRSQIASQTRHRPPARKAPPRRRGAATAELAILLPLFVLIVIGSLECAGMIYLNQSLHIAAYEGARLAIKPDTTNSQVSDRAHAVLSVRNINSASIAFDPPNVSDAAVGETITISLSAPCEANSAVAPWFFQGRTLRGQTTMVKE